MSTAPAPPAERLASSSARPAPGRSGMIQQAAVLGAGTMGVRIAAHLANAGIPVVLLDLAGDTGKPIASAALEALGRAKPAAFYDPANARLIQPGTFKHCLGAVGGPPPFLVRHPLFQPAALYAPARGHPHP